MPAIGLAVMRAGSGPPLKSEVRLNPHAKAATQISINRFFSLDPMSKNWLRYVPSDPHFQPTVSAAESARALLQTILPEAEEVTIELFENPAFIDPGSNWSGVCCSSCGADAEAWWTEAMSTAAEQNFASLDTVAPCCQAKVSLNDLTYAWPAAFGRFVLDAMNPNVGRISDDQVNLLGNALGCSVREVSQHL
jgi:hypothetical protein